MIKLDFPEYWLDSTVVVAGSGPGLTSAVAKRCKSFTVLAVNDAVDLFPQASVLYGADSDWWEYHKGKPDFGGARWSVTDPTPPQQARKLAIAAMYKISLVQGSTFPGFSLNRNFIHYGMNSGFQGINLAINFGARRIVLVGFNMTGTHFFGNHPVPLRNADPEAFIRHFDTAAQIGYPNVEIINATPNSMLTCFPRMSLDEALS